ncbi:MAG: proline dehydrogenase family protein, partial [Planktomarina sp.]
MDKIRTVMRDSTYLPDAQVLDTVMRHAPAPGVRADIAATAAGMVDTLRRDADPSMMELFLGEYGLSSDEGVALMCLAEALLRVPDPDTMEALIEDKIAPSEWGHHLGESHSMLVNASTWALYVTGQVLDDPGHGVAGVLRGAIKRLGEPVIRQAVSRVMREMGQQFVLGETITKAIKRAKGMELKGYTYSYDMLGEAAMTDADARAYHMSYADAISQIAKAATHGDIRDNPGISVKLSALHPRYDQLHRDQVMRDLLPRVRSLAVLAKSAGIGFNIDAEEAARLDLSLDIIQALLSDPALDGWDGFGVVVQAYGKRAAHVIDWLVALADQLDRKIMVRLVKGAYWDTEIKLAQVEGLPGFPVFGAKHNTDVNYICCAAKLLDRADRIYPQFATHNAHTIAAVLNLAHARGAPAFEFQRLHGMGEALHDQVLQAHGTRCRIYAPVGHHQDLLAYLVRRLLENGANSSFVNQIFDEDVPSSLVAADPFAKLGEPGPIVDLPRDLFAPTRVNSSGLDLADPLVLERARENQ